MLSRAEEESAKLRLGALEEAKRLKENLSHRAEALARTLLERLKEEYGD